MALLPNTDGEIKLYQGRDCNFTVAVLDDAGVAQAASGYTLAMQIRATIESDTVLIDVAEYATSSPTALSAEVAIPGGVSGALTVDRVAADWIADAKFVKTGSDPVEATDAGRFTVHFYPEVTR